MMKVTIFLFAGLADLLKASEITLETERSELTAGELKRLLQLQYPYAQEAIRQSFIAKNHAYAAEDECIMADDELALIPPVSGGEPHEEAFGVQLYEITDSAISIEDVSRKVAHANHGAVLVFIGSTREYTHGKRTVLLEYEGYVPMAVKTMERIGLEIAQQWPGTLAAITHRLGRVAVHEISVVIAVSSPHREACYEASRYAIDRLKQIVPIWKKEVWEDGTEWIGHQKGPWDPTADCSQYRRGGKAMNERLDVNTRYSRQMLFPPIGEAGQARLAGSRIAIVGMGALGTVLANHMVRAGVGFVRLIDRDYVEYSNLQRQMLYDEQDAVAMAPKAVAAANRLRSANSSVEIEPHIADLNPTNAEALLSDVDLVLDGTDNFSVRFLINDVCVKHEIAWIYGGAVSSRGVTMTIVPGTTPCLRCMFESAPAPGTVETCDTSGVIGPIIHVVASYQAVEALKWLVGDQEHMHGQMIHWDLWSNRQSAIQVANARKPQCPACGLHRFDFLQSAAGGDLTQTLCGRDSVQIIPGSAVELRLTEWAERLAPLGEVDMNPFLLKFSCSDSIKLVLFPDGRALIQGTNDPVLARSLYSRYVGS